MTIQFMHTADIHLGNHQYQSDERYNDFGLAFVRLVDAAIERRVAFVVVAGDLFHKRSIDALTLYQAQVSLGRLREANIPALIIEGNHDRAFYRDAGVSWLSFLAWTNGTILLAPDVAEGQITFQPWDAGARRGSYYDVPGTDIRVYGLPWYGASTGAMIQRTGAALAAQRDDEPGVRYRVLLLHTGVDGMVPTVHGLPSRQAFEPLRGLVDYIALGHVHMPYALDDWIYNPGSLETVSAEEWDWPERGYYLVEVDTAHATHQATLIPTPRRRFIRERFRVDGIETPEELLTRFDAFCERKLRDVELDAAPVLDFTLTGTLAFDPNALDRRALETIARRHCHPIVVQLRNHTQSLEYAPTDSELDGRDRATRQELELSVFRELLLRDSRFAPEADAWARAMAELKQHTLDGDSPEQIAAWLVAQRQRWQRPQGA